MAGKPLVGITMGDPAGIGAEVIAKALAEGSVHDSCRPFVIGSTAAMEAAVRVIGGGTAVRGIAEAGDAAGDAGAIDVLDLENLAYGEVETGQISTEAGRASVEWVLKAGELAKDGEIAAIATAPINKEAARLAGYEDVGHMEIFQSQTGASNVATMLMAGRLRVVHLTTHRSLRRACDYVTTDNVLAKTILTHEHFEAWGFPAPRIAVSALNPHASDGGLIGDEEAREITPAVEAARVARRGRYGASAGGHGVQPGHRWAVRRGAGDVPRPGARGDQGARLGEEREREPGAAVYPDVGGPWDGVRHRGQGGGGPPKHAGGDRRGGGPGGGG